jgi:hypothetical protein
MVWLLVALPLASVIASALLIYSSVTSGGDDAIADTVERTAQIQDADLGPDARAGQRQLVAVLRIDRDLVELLPVSGDFDRGASLRLALRHPTRADADRQLLLRPQGNGWQARLAVDRSHDWRVMASPVDGSWRILGRLPKGQRATRLGPVLAAP